MYDELMDSFSMWLVRNGRKETTIKGHIKRLKYLSKQIEEFKIDEIDKFVLNCLERGLKNSSVNAYIDTIKVWGRFQHLKDIEDYKHLKPQKTTKAIMSDDEIERFLAIKNVPKTSEQMHAIFTMFWTVWAFSGMRGKEVSNLTVSDIDFGSNTFILSDTKTNESRYVPIAPNIKQPLNNYIIGLSTPHLFMTSRNKKLSDKTWGRDFHKRLKLLGIKRNRLTPYSLRHSFITRLLEEDVNMFKVQKIVGHKKIETTANYTHLTQKDVQKAIIKHPMIQNSLGVHHKIQRFIESINTLQEDERLDVEFKKKKGFVSVCVRYEG